MTHTIERPKNKHINWKFEDVGLKHQFYERLDNMLDAAPGGLLRVNRGSDVNRLTDLLTFTLIPTIIGTPISKLHFI